MHISIVIMGRAPHFTARLALVAVVSANEMAVFFTDFACQRRRWFSPILRVKKTGKEINVKF